MSANGKELGEADNLEEAILSLSDEDAEALLELNIYDFWKEVYGDSSS